MQKFQADYHTADNSCQMPWAEVKEVPGFEGATEDHTEFMGSFTYITHDDTTQKTIKGKEGPKALIDHHCQLLLFNQTM